MSTTSGNSFRRIDAEVANVLNLFHDRDIIDFNEFTESLYKYCPADSDITIFLNIFEEEIKKLDIANFDSFIKCLDKITDVNTKKKIVILAIFRLCSSATETDAEYMGKIEVCFHNINFF